MKSFIAGLLAVGAFSASFAATVELNIRDRLAQPTQQIVNVAKNTVEPIVYDVFGKQARLMKKDVADRLVVVSRPDNECPPCARQHRVTDDLIRDGYHVETIMLNQYRGKESISATPTLLYYDGDTLVLKNRGFMPYSAVIHHLKKPRIKPDVDAERHVNDNLK